MKPFPAGMAGDTLTLPAPAKLNLFLHINAQRDDGYHELQTIFQFVECADTLTFHKRADSELVLNNRIPGIPNADNLILRAAKLLQQHDRKRQGVEITLQKALPIGSGLGGGSSNAATTLLGLNKLWNLKLPIEFLVKMGLQLGADVPVFVEGHACWAEGVGEKITSMDLPEPWYVLLFPPVQISTAAVFFDEELPRATPQVPMSLALLVTGVNDCQELVAKRYPIVAEALAWLAQFGRARLTGTGSTIFASFTTQSEAQEVYEKIPAPFTGCVTRGLNVSPLLTALRLAR
jgi:4-diphosphocytidyl-2-C-methyl-D-erythritol kinase